jgi:hypothetical protein
MSSIHIGNGVWHDPVGGDPVDLPPGLAVDGAYYPYAWERTFPNGARMETDSAKRKAIPMFSGLLAYFPDALAEVAALSQAGNDKHNPGQPLHWARGKSTDELDCLMRHLAEAGNLDTDGYYHDVKVAWRALANLQKLLEQERNLPISRGSRK